MPFCLFLLRWELLNSVRESRIFVSMDKSKIYGNLSSSVRADAQKVSVFLPSAFIKGHIYFKIISVRVVTDLYHTFLID